MEPHQQRVVDEKTELDTKIEALAKFIDGSPIFAKLAAEERGDLLSQISLMERYSDLLGRRIARF